MITRKPLALTLALTAALSVTACGPPSPSSSYGTEETGQVWSPMDENGDLKRTDRDAFGEHGMVASSNVYATMAGLEILEAGGNAVDAAVAVAYALGVAEPYTSGLGGGGFMLIHTADGQNHFLDYRETAPAAQDAYTWLDENGELLREDITYYGGLSVGVPGLVAGMEYALEHYGSGELSRQEIMQPAIDLANEGYLVSATMSNAINESYQHILDYSELGEYYLNEGLPYESNAVITNPDLAKAMEQIAQKGRDAFYTGEMAQAIVDAVQKYGGVLSLEDLAGYEVKERDPISSTYRGYEVISVPPASSGGTHLLEILNVLENYNLKAMEVNSSEYLHLFSEAFKAAFADRAEYMADTDFAEDVPLSGLISKEYAKTIADKITDQSQSWSPGDPSTYGHVSTTSFSIADQAGNMVTVTQTINHFFGSLVAVPGYGFVLNDQMTDFSMDPESVNCVEPGKRPLSSMSPTVVLNPDGSPLLTLGSPGGVRIFTTLAQVISHVIDHGMDIQTAIDTARIFDDGTSDGICYESGGITPVGPETVEELERIGHVTTDKGEWQLFFGGVQGIQYLEDGTLHGGADPRRDGKALGF